MKELTAGQYITGESVIHGLDPRTKVLGCFAYIIAAVIPVSYIFNLLVYIICLAITIHISKVGVYRILRGLKHLRYFFILTFAVQMLLTAGDPLITFGIITVTSQGLYLGIITFLRLTIIYMSSSLLTMTTSPLKLTAGIEALLYPLNFLRVPVSQLAMIISIALRFVPAILMEADVITRAQKSRGARFETGPLLARAQTYLAVLIPILASSLQRANDLALAMESRCYAINNTNRFRLSSLSYTRKDRISAGILSIMFLLQVLIVIY